MFSRNDIVEAIKDGELKIYPLETKNLTGIGYNISTTHFAFSINQGILLTIHQRTTSRGVEHYVEIPKNDTVLFFSKEYIDINNKIAGTIHSKVSRVCQGLGHVSTTIDPTWKGQLIISVNNPTDKNIIFDLDKDSGNILTLLLYRLDTEVTGPNIHDNNKGRCDLLLEHFSKPVTSDEYRDKHLQLKEFVTGEFADSLNGYDNFLEGDSAEDKYKHKVEQLKGLLSRLEKDLILIRENRYELGTKGSYELLRNKDEKSLIEDCSVFDYKCEGAELEFSTGNIENDAEETQNIIKKYIDIINYDLEMINHIRRVEWQNKRMEQFAGEESELVKLRHREITKKLYIRFAVPLFVIVVFTFLLFFGLFKLKVSAIITASVATIYAPILTFALQGWYNSWKKFDLNTKALKK